MTIALATTFAFDDAASTLSDPAPHPLRVRRGLRLTLVAAAWAALTAAVLAIGGFRMEQGLWPAERFWLESATLGAWGLACAAFITRGGEAEPGRLASAILLALFGIAWFVPTRFALFVEPGDRRWDSVAIGWWITLAVALVTAVATSWDARVAGRLRPSSRTIRRMMRGHS